MGGSGNSEAMWIDGHVRCNRKRSNAVLPLKLGLFITLSESAVLHFSISGLNKLKLRMETPNDRYTIVNRGLWHKV
jgi:hypothetical protein